jgi:hypothetical protein
METLDSIPILFTSTLTERNPMKNGRYALPFDHVVIGMLEAANHRFITVARNHPLHPFISYTVSIDGRHCESGHYCETRSEAFGDMYLRAMRWLTSSEHFNKF